MSRAALAGLLADRNVARVLAALDGAGEETRIVGGAVRNALIGIAVADIDMATTAAPDIVVERAKAAGLKVALTGYEHGTVTVISGHRPFEVTSLREDVETDGRRAKVRFGRDFDEDARRRDFTINSMSLTADGVLHDPLDGQADLAERRVRFIGDARKRIAEDYLRILRFFRFHAAYGRGPLDAEGLAAAIDLREGLTRLSAERVRVEILKLMAATRGPDVVREAADAGLLEFAIGGIVYSSRLDGLARIEASERRDADALLRLAAAGALTTEDCERLRERLRLSNAEHKRLVAALRALETLHGAAAPPRDVSLATRVFEFGAEATCDALMLAQAEARGGADVAVWQAARDAAREMGDFRLPVSGEDLKQRGLSEGRAIGAALKHLQARWIREGFPRDPAVIARLIDEAVAAAEE
ncbi:MAG: CCA tRNA nucleotidyltransferase [Beijerinckiaceae bacterium]